VILKKRTEMDSKWNDAELEIENLNLELTRLFFQSYDRLIALHHLTVHR